MNVIRPLQISFNSQVLEQNRKFYFIVSATLGVNLQTGEELLDLNYLKDVFECMGENPMPDMGMPKPFGEFLVSGNYFAPDNKEVTGGEVKVILGNQEKNLFVFGPRSWKQGLPGKPDKITTMPLDYTNAFGGQDFERNPEGIGFNDGLLPCIETPDHLVGSKKDYPDPAGFSSLYPTLPQRTQFQGTYDEDYIKKYFPGYPGDHDWKFFLCAPPDQWIDDFYRGNEQFLLYNMHPQIPVISGNLPGFATRCFINQQEEGRDIFRELSLNLDTIWFFPEKVLGLMIFRGVMEVADDEAQFIIDVLCAYEDKSQPSRSLGYYKKAFEKRKNSDDDMLKNLNTPDLIPGGHKSAMVLLIDAALSIDNESALVKNIEVKAESMQKIADEKIEEAIQQTEEITKNIDIPDEAKAHLPGEKGQIDIRELMSQKSEAGLDPDLEKLNNKLESIMPGITAGDPKKLDFENFSFDSFDEIMAAVGEFSGKKEQTAKGLAKKELEKAKEQTGKQLENIDRQMEQIKNSADADSAEELKSLEITKARINESLGIMDDIDLDGVSKGPLPRIPVEEIKAQAEQIDPRMVEAIQHIQSIKAMGIEDENTKNLEEQVQKAVETAKVQIEEGLKNAQTDFKKGYIMGAHFMEEGLSPHKGSLEDVKKRFLGAVLAGEEVAGGDWACIDLSGANLDGIDLSGAFLEQVKFKGASLKNVNFSGAILARADFEEADFTGANFEDANVGAVHALGANFTRANLKSAKLSNGDFTRACFEQADLEGIESLKIVIDGADFTKAHMPMVIFLETKILGAKFIEADMGTSAFMKCSIKDCDFSRAVMPNCVFVDTQLTKLSFENSDLSNACFVVTESETLVMEGLRFRGACLKQANFQNIDMQKSDLTHTNMENAFWGGADLSGANLSHAQAKNAQFRKTKLIRAKLDMINLDQGSLAKANLVGASFVGANLHAVDFLRSTITHTDFQDSNLDTTLIENWRPE
ncbi:MAG: DUF2169 domain-containing protein [Desulfobacteraceae bacterium]|nr:DUF2169 domain-containing protein [Desulfobacteraceae bacterium]